MAHLQLPDTPAAPILELHSQRKVFHIPPGLKTMLEDCTREVMRIQPTNIYDFLAGILEDKLILRDVREMGMGMRSEVGSVERKSWKWRRWSWEGSSILSQEDLVEFVSEFQISVEEAKQFAVTIQSAYRGFLARKNVKVLKLDHDLHRQELWEEWRRPGLLHMGRRDIIEILGYYNISLQDANALVTKIQKVYRGHLNRKKLEETRPDVAAHIRSLGVTRKRRSPSGLPKPRKTLEKPKIDAVHEKLVEKEVERVEIDMEIHPEPQDDVSSSPDTVQRMSLMLTDVEDETETKGARGRSEDSRKRRSSPGKAGANSPGGTDVDPTADGSARAGQSK